MNNFYLKSLHRLKSISGTIIIILNYYNFDFIAILLLARGGGPESHSQVNQKHSGRHMALSHLVTLSISSLRNLDIEANKLYDRAHRLYDAAILTRCYTQHALRPYIDSEINHIRHFIKIQFVNKGIEFISLPNIFKDKSVISSIPTYFENKESPIICYKYNKPICSTVFNYNKLVTELDIENYIPDS